jgi:hypothetical protein
MLYSQIWRYSKYSSRKKLDHPFMLYVVVVNFGEYVFFVFLKEFFGNFFSQKGKLGGGGIIPFSRYFCKMAP